MHASGGARDLHLQDLHLQETIALTIAMQVKMQHDLHLTTETFGLASGIFFLAYGSMQVPQLHLIQLVGARRILSASLLLWGVIASATSLVQVDHTHATCTLTTCTLTTCTCLVQDPLSLCMLRFCLGLAEAAFVRPADPNLCLRSQCRWPWWWIVFALRGADLASV